MLIDIVVDTNVLLHATNQQEARHVDSEALLNQMKICAVVLCVDEGFDMDEAKNRSYIGGEYVKHLRQGSLGYAVIDHLARSLRVRPVPRSVPQNVSRQIQRRVGKGPDRTFVRVAFNSHDKTLASHDFTDIPPQAREILLEKLAVKVLAADEALAIL